MRFASRARQATALLLLSVVFALSFISPNAKAITMNRPIKGINHRGVQTGKGSRHRTPIVERFLIAGDLNGGEIYLVEHLRQHPKDDQAKFGLGVLRFLHTVEIVGQTFHRYGLRSEATRAISGPIIRLPVPENDSPKIITYERLRMIIDAFRTGLLSCDSTLAEIDQADVNLPLHFSLIKLDLNGDGTTDENERLWRIYRQISRNSSSGENAPDQTLVCFDRGDVHWLRGYCNLLAALAEIVLAYDSRETFEHTAHLIFKRVDSPYKFLAHATQSHNFRNSDASLFDIVALVHSVHWQVIEPELMKSALHHLENVVDQSHTSWRWIMAETDDDHEWLPNPNQTGVIPNARVTKEMVEAWGECMTEAGAILHGDILIPFWRTKSREGINLRKVFLQPTALDVVYWVQGTAATPYLETGRCTEPELWNRLMDVFGHNFPGYALWFN